MKKILVAGIAAAAFLSAPALAQTPSVFNWSGWYIGGNAGWQHAQDKWGFDPPIPAAIHMNYTVKGDGAIFGGQAGFQQQVGSWLWGVELAGSGGTHWNDETMFGNNSSLKSQTHVTNIWTLGPRLGWVNGPWLLYGTGGGAAAEVNSRAIVLATGAPAFVDSKWAAGWYVGGGFEYALSNYWIAGVEYQYVALNSSKQCVAGLCLGAAGAFVDRDVTARENIVRARLSYLFNSSR